MARDPWDDQQWERYVGAVAGLRAKEPTSAWGALCKRAMAQQPVKRSIYPNFLQQVSDRVAALNKQLFGQIGELRSMRDKIKTLEASQTFSPEEVLSTATGGELVAYCWETIKELPLSQRLQLVSREEILTHAPLSKLAAIVAGRLVAFLEEADKKDCDERVERVEKPRVALAGFLSAQIQEISKALPFLHIIGVDKNRKASIFPDRLDAVMVAIKFASHSMTAHASGLEARGVKYFPHNGGVSEAIETLRDYFAV